jgi:hypothetical protein
MQPMQQSQSDHHLARPNARMGDSEARPMSKRVNRIQGQFDAREITLLESPAFRAASLACRKIMDRLAIELAHHGGKDNGRLPVTYNQFVEYGIHRDAIGPAIREGEALGLFFVAERGRASAGEFRAPNRFRISYRPVGSNPATNEWRKIKTDEEAEAIARAARNPRPKKQKSSHGIRTRTNHGNHDRNGKFPVPDSMTTRTGPESMTTSISRGGGEQLPVTRPKSYAGRAKAYRERKKARAALADAAH